MSNLKIVILDANCANPGDLSWEEFESLGEVSVYPHTDESQVVERAADADIIIDNKVNLSATTIASLPKLRYIGLLSTGYNVVDLAAAKKRGIPVCNVPAYSTMSVAQHAIMLLTALAAKLPAHAQSVNKGEWGQCKNFCLFKGEVTELSGKTLGIIGYGSIGRAVARIALAMGMKVVACKRHTCAADKGVTLVDSLDELLLAADAITLHCDLNAGNAEMVNEAFLSKVKRGSILVNTARGGLVDENAVRKALDEGILSGYGADVLAEEPPVHGSALIGADNCIITPHVAWASIEARSRLLKAAKKNIDAFIEGNPINLVY